MLCVVRVPLKLMPLALVSALAPEYAGKLLDFPIPSAARAVTLRPLVANCVTCWPLMRLLTSLLSDCTCNASASTLTVSCVLPTLKATFSSSVWATWIRIPARENFWNPGADAVRVYWPAPTLANRKSPLEFETVFLTWPVATLVIVMLAFTTAAPEGSITVPVSEALSCAPALAVNTTRIAIRAQHIATRFQFDPSVLKLVVAT